MNVKPIKYPIDPFTFNSFTRNINPVNTLNITHWKNKSRGKIMWMLTGDPPTLTYLAPLVHKKEIYAATLPSPPMLFLLQAKEHARAVSELLEKFQSNVESIITLGCNENIKIINSELYNTFLLYKISSLTALIMSVESFLNSIIPEDYKTNNSKGEINNKMEIERNWDLKSKLEIIVPEIRVIKNMTEYKSTYPKILQLNHLRNSFIHLKTKRNNSNADPYIDHFESLINLNLKKNISLVEDLINYIEPNYFE